ncbi:MAG: hypothetical protein ACYS0E_09235 [Planctomycetota bacterium]|jgi:hypothetical protein
MKRSLAALAIALVVLGSFATAEGDAVLIRAPQGARYRVWDTKMGTLMLDTATGHSWRLEFQEKSGYVWSQIPRAMMKDPGFPVDNPMK